MTFIDDNELYDLLASHACLDVEEAFKVTEYHVSSDRIERMLERVCTTKQKALKSIA